jgi:DNA mismatch repair protein MLH3
MEERSTGRLNDDSPKMTGGSSMPSTTSPKPARAILPLPSDVIAQIKSSTTITSLAGVITSLLQNSLDAGSTKISLDVDFSRGNATVEDNGCGISPSEFREDGGGLGRLYHTSKYAATFGRTYGTNGTFLASLAAMCFLTITSKHEAFFSTNSLLIHHSSVKARYLPAPAAHRLERGTRVVVRDLFGNMPVRVKQRGLLAQDPMEMEKLWEELRAEALALLIAYGKPVTVKMRDLVSGKTASVSPPSSPPEKERSMLSPKHQLALSLLHQAGKLSPRITGSWIPASASSKSITISGIISSTPAPTKSIQFLHLGIIPLPKSSQHPLYEHINRLFLRSHFGAVPEEEISEEEKLRRQRDRRFKVDGLTMKQTLVQKGVERWPMFVLGIEVKDGAGKERGEEMLGSEAVLAKITGVLDALVGRWLEAHHFRRPAHRVDEKDAADGEMLDSDRVESRATTPQSRQQSPAKRPRPYTGVATVNSLSRIKSSHSIDFGHTVAKIHRPESAPASKTVSGTVSPSKRPAINVETFSFDWPDAKPTKKPAWIEETAPCEMPNETSLPPLSPAEQIDAEDEYMDWTDPITKQRHKVNTRTGMQIPDPRSATDTAADNGVSRLPSRPSKRVALPSRGTPSTASKSPAKDGWLDAFLQTWDNPIFATHSQPITRTSFDLPDCNGHSQPSKAIDQAFSEVSRMNASKISKTALKNAKFIAQVDEKFVFVRLVGVEGEELLVAVDQHAADERVKVEELLRELCQPPDAEDLPVSSQPSGLTSAIKTTTLDKPLKFAITSQEADLFRRHASYCAAWGILYDQSTTQDGQHHVLVRTLPSLVIERCTNDPKLLITLLRTEIWSRHENGITTTSSTARPPDAQDPSAWVKLTATCPKDLLNMANSRACRSAVMFNDTLSLVECEGLVERLADCAFPFMCAHGRPSMVPLIDLGGVMGVSEFGGGMTEAEDESFADVWGRWRNRTEMEGEDGGDGI